MASTHDAGSFPVRGDVVGDRRVVRTFYRANSWEKHIRYREGGKYRVCLLQDWRRYAASVNHGW